MMTIVEDILSGPECVRLINMYERYSPFTPQGHVARAYGGRPMLDYYTLKQRNAKEADWLHQVALRCKERIEADIPEAKGIYLESLYVTCMVPGDSHPPHADNEREEEPGTWGPNHTPQRDYTGIAYLNDGFGSGELVFPDRNLIIKPKPGLLVGFKCNHEFVHGVPEIVSGQRYAIPMWFTFDQEKAMEV
jgi:hypothetical protein